MGLLAPVLLFAGCQKAPAPVTTESAAAEGGATGAVQSSGGQGGSAPSIPVAGAEATPPVSMEVATSDAGASGRAGAAGAGAAAPDAAGAGGVAGEAAVSEPPALGPSEHKLLEREWFSGPMLGYDTQYMDRPFDLGAGPFAEVTLSFQLESPCFPFDKWSASPPPDGELFPAQCDRFDRLMYFEIDPAAEGDASAAPGLQVLRAITPYGGPMEKTVDMTDFANTTPGPHSLRSFLGTWVDDEGQVSGSDGGYFLSVTIRVKHGTPERRALAVTSLFSGWFSLETAEADLPFVLPEGTQRAQLQYLVTGHGGAMDPSSACIGAAEEFCQRTHHLTVDDSELTPEGYARPAFVPWRDDCGELCTRAQGHPMMGAYCQENPNRMERSVTAPRANWCPGDSVAAIVAQLPAAQVTPGMHRARFAIDDMYPDGRWQVALAVYAYGD